MALCKREVGHAEAYLACGASDTDVEGHATLDGERGLM